MATKWTEQQLNAISAKGSVIVTAAAGSGKTAVLVERVIGKLCDPVDPIPADRLLIVTFTRAAAAEMRQRIEKALSDRCAAEPGNVALLKQQLLISSADICTIDSFCIKLVRNYFNTLGLSPDFEIADTNTAMQLRRLVMQEIFAERFDSGDPDFLRFLNATDSVYGDGNAADAVMDLYDFCSTMAQGERWLTRAAEAYLKPVDRDSVWITALCDALRNELPLLLEQVEKNITLLKTDAQLGAKCTDAYTALHRYLDGLLSAAETRDYDALCADFENPPTSLPRLVAKQYDPEHLTCIKTGYQQAKKWVDGWKGCFFGGMAQLKRDVEFCRNTVCQMTALCAEFSTRYLEALTARSLLTFSHTEQLALQLLTEETEAGVLFPSEIAKTVCDLYDEVMVDEFQDVNDLQSRLFEILSDGGKKLFTVGDAKQSIYGFRGANPEHFLARSAHADFYSPELEPDLLKRVVLSRNFRSRAGVCEFINGFFALTMSKAFGGISYDRNEILYSGAVYPENGKTAVEAHFLHPAKELSNAEAEAIHLADYIEQTVETEPFLRENSETLRRAKHGDFAILLRKSGNFSTYVKVLKERGIPVSLGHGNFFETTEIMTAISLLRVIDRPLNDIAMLAVMLSPIFGFTEDEVASLKKQTKGDRFYRAILRMASSHEKCRFLQEKLAFWREKSACMPMGDFVSLLLSDSGYGNIVLSMSEPERRQSNLILLEELAAAFARDKMGDLAAFLRHLEYLAEAGDTKSQSPKMQDSVRIMTVHMSKGLQFPITILGDCFSLFNRKETAADIAFSEPLGIALNPVDDALNTKHQTLPKAILNKALLRKQWEEELRLLYVAMTRAEERLVFFFTADSFETKLKNAAERLISSLDETGNISPVAVQAGGSIGDWLLLYLLLLPAGKALYPAIGDFSLPKATILQGVEVLLQQQEVCQKEPISVAEQPLKEPADPQWCAALESVLKYRYPYEELRAIETKTSVSALTKRKAGREFCATARPAFLSSGGLTPTERGTALHKFMQYADFPAAQRNVAAEIDRLFEFEFISRAEADAIDVKRVETFMQTALFDRILRADRLFREQRFLLEVPAGELYPTLSEQVRERGVIVQGAVDCMFIEGDHIVLIDFKTDRTNDEAFLLSHYAEQLRTYCHAAEKMFSLPVTECYLYSLHMSKQIKVELAGKNHA